MVGFLIFRLIGTCVTGTGCALPVGISVEKEDPTGVSWQVSIFPFVRVCSNCDEFDVCQLKEEEKRVEGAR